MISKINSIGVALKLHLVLKIEEKGIFMRVKRREA